MKYIKVKSIEEVEIDDTYDLQVEDNHNFYLSNKILSHNSGSGKSQLNKATLDFCRRLGITATDSTKFTEAGLIGSFDKEKHNYNIKNGLGPGEESNKLDKNGNNKRVIYQKPIVYGDLHNYDMLFIDEAKILFEKSRHTEDILSVLQPALDFPGRVRKKLAAEDAIEYDCMGTIVASTVEWGDVGKDIMSQGYFPRCAFYSRNLSIVDQMNHQSDLMRCGNFREDIFSGYVSDFADLIEKHDIPMSRDKHRIMVDDNCMESIGAKITYWFTTIQDKLQGQNAKVLQALTARMHVFVFKFAGQMAVINNSVNEKIKTEKVFLVTQTEIDYAFSVMDHLFNKLVDNINLSASREDSKLYSIMIVLLKEMEKDHLLEISKGHFINKIIRIANCGRNGAVKIYANLYSANFIGEKNSITGMIVLPKWEIWYDINKKHEVKQNDEKTDV